MAILSNIAAFTHDCDACRLVAHVQPAFGQCFDLYQHPGEDGTVVARTGDEGADYQSLPAAMLALFPVDTETTMGRAAWLIQNESVVRKILDL